MISDIQSFLRFFEAVHRRTVRDVDALPKEAERWMPPADEGEQGWGPPEIVRHIAEARQFFAGAFAGSGWVWESWPESVNGREEWVPMLETSWDRFAAALGDTDDSLLRRKVALIGEPERSVSGWRVLMMAAEHEVHHRSQLVTYAGMNGWPVHQIFGRSNEWVLAQREVESRTRPESPRG
ncbi:MAG TPA: DinB family protein [Actinomycetota bacterium]|nr:DinB family protein [Actinomycetota bacterium]